jgi:hypothetical protein
LQYGYADYFATGGGTPEGITFGQQWSKGEQQLFDPDRSEWDMRDASLSLAEGTYGASTVYSTHDIQ